MYAEESKGSGLFGLLFLSGILGNFFSRFGGSLDFDFFFVVVVIFFAADGAAEKFLLFGFVRAAGDVHGDVHRDFRVQNDTDLL